MKIKNLFKNLHSLNWQYCKYLKIQEPILPYLKIVVSYFLVFTIPRLQVLCKWLAIMVAWCTKTIGSWGIEVSEFTWFIQKLVKNKPVLCYQFTEVILKCFSWLVSAENTCTFNNNKLFKTFKEKLAVTPGAITCIPALRFMRKWKLLPSMYQDAVYTSPHGGHQKFQWEGGPRRGNFQEGGVRFSRYFFPGTLKLIVFIDDLTFNSYSWVLFFTA